MKFQMIQEDIDNAVREMSNGMYSVSCPIAQCLKRVTGKQYYVNQISIYTDYWEEEQESCYGTPPECVTFINLFDFYLGYDNEKLPKPISFELEIK